jgi:hypothetical protein
MFVQDFQVSAKAEFERKAADDPGEEAVQRAQVQPRHRVNHPTKQAEEVRRTQRRLADHGRQLRGFRGAAGRMRQLLQDLIEKLPRRLAREGERHDPLRRCTEGEQSHDAIGQREGLAGASRR